MEERGIPFDCGLGERDSDYCHGCFRAAGFAQGLCLVKIGRAFEINEIQRDVVTCDIHKIQLSRSFGEGQRYE